MAAAERENVKDVPEWLEKQWKSIVKQSGSIQHLDYLTDSEKELFKTAFELDQHWVVEQADARQQYVCQSQSLNLFFPSGVSREYFNSVHLKALVAKHIKSLYYTRMERSVDVDMVKKIERKALIDWADTEECVSCHG
jgi:ribonucleoside-diphosphate reductase alpha chain